MEGYVELRVVSWNVDGWHTIREEQMRLLDQTGADLALLQEVTPASLDLLRQASWRGTSALELVPDDHTERRGVRPRFASAILARGEVTIDGSNLIARTSSPVRALQSQIGVQGVAITVISAALPPGSLWGGPAKRGQAEAIAEAIASVENPVIVGMDRNGPKFERWNPADTEWWPEDPADFFDTDASHGCIDVLDRWYSAHEDALHRSHQQRPDGPREVSYTERRADPPIPRRYDLIMASRDVQVRDVRYRYSDAMAAGSDHGLVDALVSL
jgi:endonuclease/exonuclease/phosphatase family metal-dependent hydrolase